MPFSKVDINKLSTLISLHVDRVTCIECCKYYMVPSTSPCGHTLCHGCWIGRKKCAVCGAAVNRKSLKLNIPLQNMTEHTKFLRDEFKSIFKVDLDYLPDVTFGKESIKDPTKNVIDWLANSENQFSAPEANQQTDIGSTVQVHNETSKTNTTRNIIHTGISQDDWDKIEELPDTEELYVKNKENVVGPMDIEPFVAEPYELTTDKPRRSSRKRDVKANRLHNTDSNSTDQDSTKESTNAAESKVMKHKWANVKRKKKEFSKLNKISKNKLNVSIEMCKKTVTPASKNKPIVADNSRELVANFDANTPHIDNVKECAQTTRNMDEDQLYKKKQPNDLDVEYEKEINQTSNHIIKVQKNELSKSSNTAQLQPPNVHGPSVAFIMKGALQVPSIAEHYNSNDNKNIRTIMVDTDNVEQTKCNEDIDITIKIGNTVTSIYIKKKEKDVQLKINADREIQTTLEKCTPTNKNNVSCSPIREILNLENNVTISLQNNEQKSSYVSKRNVFSKNTTISSKKNTESADTATVQYEITASVEKELSKEMEKPDVENPQHTHRKNNKGNTNKVLSENDILDADCLNDLDLFDNDSVKEGNIQTLKSSNHAPSEILVSTLKSNRSKKQTDKRVRDAVNDDLPNRKKMKIILESNENAENGNPLKTIQSDHLEQYSERNNYDIIMGNVFANIDTDLAKESNERTIKNSQLVKMGSNNLATLSDSIHGQSENMFSLLERENNVLDKISSGKTLVRAEIPAPSAKKLDCDVLIEQDLGTPLQDDIDHSDESIVEETPQKNTSFHKIKQKSGGSLNTGLPVKNKSLKLKRAESDVQNRSTNSVINISDLTDGTRKSKRVTILEVSKPKTGLETPITITNFVEQIKHRSTPMAKKSLNFDNENTEKSNHTLCPSSFVVAKTTQEREIMSKAFEESLHTQVKSPLTIRHLRQTVKKYCLAGSCLTPSEISNLKLLCSLQKWDYQDKYTNGLTHLVVGVDEENKSKRSVKYMCALAASKWIVSYEWVQKCLQMKRVVDEELFEALDSTGEPGPQRSRLAKRKLFEGITFFCMPPFSVLDFDTLKLMIEAAGGRVVDEAKEVRVTNDSISLLLAEPEHTQENRFIYLAMELCIVPVNSEWVLNCLGSYTISSILELLLCPESLLPPFTAQWPPELMEKDYDEI